MRLIYILFPLVIGSGIPSFGEFLELFSKNYSFRSLQLRESIYYSNVEMITKHNANPIFTYKLGINYWADQTWEEFRENKLIDLGLTETVHNMSTENFRSKIPSSINWVSLGKVNSIKEQGNCGSCWAFSAISSLESVIAIAQNGILPVLSEQQLIDCDMGNSGCNGGLMSRAFEYISRNGINTSTGYIGCGRGVIRSRGFVRVNSKEINLLNAVSGRPVSAGIEVDELFRFYKSGIYNRGLCRNRLNHAVNIVGYTPSFWLVRNSWGSRWGESGYIRMVRNRNICGINSLVSYPIGPIL